MMIAMVLTQPNVMSKAKTFCQSWQKSPFFSVFKVYELGDSVFCCSNVFVNVLSFGIWSVVYFFVIFVICYLLFFGT